MTEQRSTTGYFRSGLPYNRLGNGPRPFVVFQGLMFENKPQPGLMVGSYGFLGKDYTVYVVLRKPGLPKGYTLRDMSDDYAAMIREEFGSPVDVLGVSTGGSIVQHFAADHPDLVRKLVIHSSAYVLNDRSRQMQMELGHLARQRRWRDAYELLMRFMFPQTLLGGAAAWLIALLASLSAPKDPSDLVCTVEAEDQHNFKDRLTNITAPTLVIAGEQDPFYSAELFRETAAGIPNAQIILYPGMRHPAWGRQFERDVLAFLRDETVAPSWQEKSR